MDYNEICEQYSMDECRENLQENTNVFTRVYRQICGVPCDVPFIHFKDKRIKVYHLEFYHGY